MAKSIKDGKVYLHKGKKAVLVVSQKKKTVKIRTANAAGIFSPKTKTVTLDMAHFAVIRGAKAAMSLIDPKGSLGAMIDGSTSSKSSKKSTKKTVASKTDVDVKEVKKQFKAAIGALRTITSPKSKKPAIKKAKLELRKLVKKFAKVGLILQLKGKEVVVGTEVKGKIKKPVASRKASARMVAYFGDTPKEKSSKKDSKKVEKSTGPSKEDEGYIVFKANIYDAEVVSVSKKNKTVKVVIDLDGTEKKKKVAWADFFTKKKDAKAAKLGGKKSSKKSTKKAATSKKKVCGLCENYKKKTHDCKWYSDLHAEEKACKKHFSRK